MGGSVSSGKEHDELIDDLVDAKYIRRPSVEKIFRTVDRAFYFLPEFTNSAYSDTAWKIGNLHLSSPCIYTEVMEQLSIEPGLSFLNIGSGTGYLSTMVGLMLGANGINHGIEIHSDVVDYAYGKLEEFKKKCNAIDMFEFCEPYFVVGNGLELCSEQKYDRVYCGAACPTTHHELIKRHLKVGGILVVPCEDELLKIVRTSEATWEESAVLSVSFSTLQSLKRKNIDVISIHSQPLSLQHACRSKIRSVLRDVTAHDNPELLKRPERKKRRPLTARRHYLSSRIVFHHPDTSRGSPIEPNRTLTGRIAVENVNYDGITFENCLRSLRRRTANTNLNESDGSDFEFDQEDSDSTSSSSSSSSLSESDIENEIDSPNKLSEVSNGDVPINISSSDGENIDAVVNKDVKKQQEARVSCMLPRAEDPQKLEMKNYHKRSFVETSLFDEEQSTSDSNERTQKQFTAESGDTSNNHPAQLLKREKLDSGISEESDDSKASVTESSFSSVPMDLESDDSEWNGSAVDNRNEEHKDFTESVTKSDHEILLLKYRTSIEAKIQALSLPPRIKQYLNYHREFITTENY